jgi:hypothetical protein
MAPTRKDAGSKKSTAEGRPALPPSKTAPAAAASAADSDGSKLLTLSQAAELIGISRQVVHRHILLGTIKTKQIRCRLFVTLDETKRFKNLDRPPGRPKSTANPSTKHPRGRPRKEPPADPPPKRPRGRPRKERPANPPAKRPRGRPRKLL